jgi:hypothetical protein
MERMQYKNHWNILSSNYAAIEILEYDYLNGYNNINWELLSNNHAIFKLREHTYAITKILNLIFTK